MHKFDPKHHARLDNPARRKILNPEEILRKAGLRPGLVVCDVGCGTGYFTLVAAELVGAEGQVYAVDSSAEMLGLLREKMAASGQAVEEKLNNIQLVLSQEVAIPLPDRLVDFAFMANVLHEVVQRATFLREVNRLVKPGGTLTVVDWVAAPTEAGPPVEDRLPREEAEELLRQTGFQVVGEFEAGPYHYGVAASKIK